MRRLCRLVFFLSVAVFATAAPSVEEGEIEQAKFTIARPAKWNGRLLLIAHGFRSETAPLVADLSPDHFAYRTLLDEGWMIAKTSYRRNGTIVTDAIADLDNLRAHIVKNYGTPRRVVLEGDSMGGLIVTRIAERHPESPPHYDGAVAVGAALNLREKDGTTGLTLEARMPLIFLTNRSEIEGPRGYMLARFTGEKIAPAAASKSPVPPVIFRIARDGHVNVNQRERLVALRALDAWLDGGRATLPVPAEGSEFFDATQDPQPGPSKVVFDRRRHSFTARVVEVTDVYGNVAIDALPADFTAIGIGPNAWFRLIAHEKTRRVLFGRGFDSVKRGDWVAFPHADGIVWIARNMENAAATAALAPGDEVVVQRYETSSPAPELPPGSTRP